MLRAVRKGLAVLLIETGVRMRRLATVRRELTLRTAGTMVKTDDPGLMEDSADLLLFSVFSAQVATVCKTNCVLL